eukprot:Selendium_serpulae@DN11392_c0_g1_i1.p1
MAVKKPHKSPSPTRDVTAPGPVVVQARPIIHSERLTASPKLQPADDDEEKAAAALFESLGDQSSKSEGVPEDEPSASSSSPTAKQDSQSSRLPPPECATGANMVPVGGRSFGTDPRIMPQSFVPPFGDLLVELANKNRWGSSSAPVEASASRATGAAGWGDKGAAAPRMTPPWDEWPSKAEYLVMEQTALAVKMMGSQFEFRLKVSGDLASTNFPPKQSL